MYKNLNRMFQDSVKKWGNRVALRQRTPEGWRRISWNRWNEGVREVCLGLRALGFQDGDRSSLIGKNCMEWVISDLGILAARGIVAPIYVTNPAREVAYVVNDSGSKFIIMENREQLEKILETRS